MAAFPFLILLFAVVELPAEDGYQLWLRYPPVSDTALLRHYRQNVTQLILNDDSPTLKAALREIRSGLTGLLAVEIPRASEISRQGALVVGTPRTSSVITQSGLAAALQDVGREGFIIRSIRIGGRRSTVIAANQDIGALYGVFHFLKHLQTGRRLDGLDIAESPRIRHRLLNHWDNLDRTVERGYAGFSLWDWHKLPDFLDPRYIDYARANASIGINSSVLTNVNANALVLTPHYLEKAAALADVFRPYGIRIFLTARFSAPIEIGGLETADPLDAEVAAWWRRKAAQIYTYIPDFGGFLVKANSEGQPGPQDYGRTHADGANMLADALSPHGGILMWRAFVYSDKVPEDRAKQAYNEFKPLDGTFRRNVLIQVKNGPIDFQPREPFHPLFGAMPATPLAMEFQITKEYLGFATHLVYLAPLYREVLESDTYARGPGSTVGEVIDGSLHQFEHERTAIAGVSNLGTDRNWCGSHFDQANWYAFGRLAWDHTLSAGTIAEEWIRRTFSNQQEFIDPVKRLMLLSREAAVDYMTPLGLHHLMGWGHHYGPAPWISEGERADWTSVYYHRADSEGIGFDRTASGSNAVEQYSPPVRRFFSDPRTIPDQFLLWFHHVPWDYQMASGRALWSELVHRYYRGVAQVQSMQKTWKEMNGLIDAQRFEEVAKFLAIQEKEARWWRDASVLYFQTFFEKPLPQGLERPAHSLEFYQALEFPFAPGH